MNYQRDLPESLYPSRRKLPHTPPWWIPDDSIWFITLNGNPRGKPQFCRDASPHETASAVLEAARFYHEMEPCRWFLHLFLLMPDHLHAMISLPPGASLQPTITAWKGFVRRQHGVVWQSDFFDHRIRDGAKLKRRFEYIRMNPVRAGLCASPEEWPHSVSFNPRTGEEIR